MVHSWFNKQGRVDEPETCPRFQYALGYVFKNQRHLHNPRSNSLLILRPVNPVYSKTQTSLHMRRRLT